MQFKKEHEVRNEEAIKEMTTITEFNKKYKVVLTSHHTSYLVLDSNEDNIHTHTDDVAAYTEICVWEDKQVTPVYRKFIADELLELEQDVGNFLIEELGLIRE